MGFIENLIAKITGVSGVLAEYLPLLGAVGGILGAASSIALRAAAVGSGNVPALLAAIHPTASEASVLALSVGAIKAHFNHQSNVAQIAAQAPAVAPVAPPVVPPAA